MPAVAYLCVCRSTRVLLPADPACACLPCRVTRCISALLLAGRLGQIDGFADLCDHWRVRFAPEASQPAQLAALAATFGLPLIVVAAYLKAGVILLTRLAPFEFLLWIFLSLARMVHSVATGERFTWPHYGVAVRWFYHGTLSVSSMLTGGLD